MSEHSSTARYIKVWIILMILMVVSLSGPIFNLFWVTMFMAFGVAVIKAYIVATEFMHIKSEKPFITYILISMIALMVIFVAGTMVDTIQNKNGHWERQKLDTTVDQSLKDVHHD